MIEQKKVNIVVYASSAWRASMETERILKGEAVKNFQVLHSVKLREPHILPVHGFSGWIVEINLPTLEQYVEP